MPNVIFKDVRKVISVSLPSYPDSSVELYDGLLFGQVNDLQKEGMSDTDRGILSLQFLIKGWNFVGEDSKQLPITVETLNQFPMNDLTFLLEKVGDFFTLGKKGKKESLKT